VPESRNQAFQSTRLRNIDFDMILIRQEEKQGKARKSKERIEKARNNSGDRCRSPGYRTYNIYRLTRSGLGFAGLGWTGFYTVTLYTGKRPYNKKPYISTYTFQNFNNV
jgi:hypothetical protein